MIMHEDFSRERINRMLAERAHDRQVEEAQKQNKSTNEAKPGFLARLFKPNRPKAADICNCLPQPEKHYL